MSVEEELTKVINVPVKHMISQNLKMKPIMNASWCKYIFLQIIKNKQRLRLYFRWFWR